MNLKSSHALRFALYATLLLSSGAAVAHHSFAMFDDRNVTLKGTVRTYEWTNPHSWLWLYVTEVDGKPVADKDGQPVVWGIELGAPGEAVRQGRSKDDFKPGDKVTATVRPLKDGRPGGSGGRIVTADGRVIGGGVPAGPGGPPGAAPAAAPAPTT